MPAYKVLLVDDEERIRKGMKNLLESVIGEYQVVAEAANGKKAMECLLTCQVDLIITDIRMPEMDGMEFIRRVRNQLPHTPIFVLSGYDEYEYMRQALKSNVTDYILKPIDRVEFAQALSKVGEIIGNKNIEDNMGPHKDKSEKDRRQVIRRVKEIINEKLHEDISLQNLANEVKYSYNHLSALFKSETGQSFSDYLTSIRLEKAKQLLRDTNLKIYEIGTICGYPNSKYFMSIFKEEFGLTPSEFRDKK